MSKVAIQGNASGTGTFTIAAPNSNTDRTLTLPDEAGTVLTSGGAIDVNASAPADSVVIDSSGNVGIGTSSPDSPMEISRSLGSFSSTGNSILKLTNTSATGQSPLDWEINGTLRGRIRPDYIGNVNYISNGGNHTFYTGGDAGDGAERMRIDSSGRLAVGTTTTTGQMVKIDNTTSSDWLLNLNNASATNKILISAQSGTGAVIHHQFNNSNGLVGKIETSGSSTTYATSSDYRLKENVVDMTDAITRVKSLAPKRFNFIADDDDTTVDGFLAHEAATVVPESVTGTYDEVDDEGNPVYQGIDQSKLVPLLTAALQEAIGRIETLEAEVATLKGASA